MNEQSLHGKNVVVIGGSRGVGREIARLAVKSGANVLVVARGQKDLDSLAAESPSIQTLALDATRGDAPKKVFETLKPDYLIHAGGPMPSIGSLQDMSWEDFSVSWNTDVKISHLFTSAALTSLAPGSVVTLISSGAALGASSISGGYGGAKRMQMFLAMYAQRESNRRGLGLHFLSVAPMRPMQGTEIGDRAVKNYAKIGNVSEEEASLQMGPPLSPRDVACAWLDLSLKATDSDENAFGVSGDGVTKIP